MGSPHGESSADTRRGIDGVDAISIVAGSMLGIGIFLNPRVVAEHLQSLEAFFGIWILGGVIALSGAAAYAELGAMFPKAGGDYVFLRRAFGDSVAAAGGWLLVLAVFPGSIATISVAVCEYQLPVLLGSFVDFDPGREWVLGVTSGQVAALGVVAALSLINAVGARASGRAQTLMTATPVVLLVLFGVYVIVTGPHATALPADPALASDASVWKRFALSFSAVYFAYSGWNAIAYVGGEVRRPSRNLPLGLVGGTVIVTALYLVLCVAFVMALGLGGLTTAFEAGTAMATSLFGDRAVIPITALIALGLFGSINGTVLGGARIAYAMAQDGMLPSLLGRLGRRSRVPIAALWVQAGASALLILSGTFEQLLAMTSLAMLILGSLTVISLYVLRIRQPNRDRPYRAFGYPWLPLLYVVVSLGVVGITFWQGVRAELRGEPAHVDFWFPLFGLGLFVVTLVVHLAWRQMRDAGAQEQPG